MTRQTTTKKFEASDIETLEIIDAIRTRPGMYLSGAGDEAIEVAVREGFDNSTDEHMNGHGDDIFITVDENNWITIEDRGRGIPVGEHPQWPGISTLEAALTKAHTGSKFSKSAAITGGLNGTGMKAVNATSTHLIATVFRDNKAYTLKFEKGRRVGDMGVSKLPTHIPKGTTGTRIQFHLDTTVFVDATSNVPSEAALVEMIRTRTFLNPELRVHLSYKGNNQTFSEPEGISGYIKNIMGEKSVSKKLFTYSHDISEENEIGVNIAIGWMNSYSRDNVFGFCNSVHQYDGGTHIQGLRMALPSLVRKYIEDNSILTQKDKDLKIEGHDCFEGLVGAIAIKHRAPTFKGQHKSSLSNGDVQGVVQRAINTYFAQWLEENPKEARMICNRAIAAAKARIAAVKAREQVRKQDSGSLGMRSFGKLKDCESRDNTVNELFIVEGDSAGGNSGMARNRVTQAIYALKGKPLNTWECDPSRVLSNDELSDLSCAIGTGLFNDAMTEEETQQALTKLRYGKVIILADGDIDGSHIECLLLGHFFKHMRPLLEQGVIHIALPPLYRATENGKHTFYRDEDALASFYRRRAKKFAGDDNNLIELASVLRQVSLIIERAAENGSGRPRDLSSALKAYLSYDTEREDVIMSFAESLLAVRSESSEGVIAEVLETGDVVISGVMNGTDFFTDVITADFINTVADIYASIAEILNEEILQDLIFNSRTIGGVIRHDIYSMAKALEKVSQAGVNIIRNKGLGEMNASELGETTLDVSSRRLIQISVENFDESGKFINTLLHKSEVESRRRLVYETTVKKTDIDA